MLLYNHIVLIIASCPIWCCGYLCCPDIDEAETNDQSEVKISHLQVYDIATTVKSVSFEDMEPGFMRTKSILDKEEEKRQKKERMKSMYFKDHYRWISWWYILRLIWRILDVSSRIFICTLSWMVIGGYALTAIICIESVVFLGLTLKTKHWELLFGIVALVISLTNGKSL